MVYAKLLVGSAALMMASVTIASPRKAPKASGPDIVPGGEQVDCAKETRTFHYWQGRRVVIDCILATSQTFGTRGPTRVSCEAGNRATFHPLGGVTSCVLAADLRAPGSAVTCAKGGVISLAESGRVRSCLLAADVRYRGNAGDSVCEKGNRAMIDEFSDGRVWRCERGGKHPLRKE